MTLSSEDPRNRRSSSTNAEHSLKSRGYHSEEQTESSGERGVMSRIAPVYSGALHNQAGVVNIRCERL